MATPEEKLAHLTQILTDMGSVLIAYSGGVDSAFLLAMATETLGPENVLGATGVSESLAPDERSGAAETAALIGARHLELQTNELANESYASNPTNRCYFCKTELFDELVELARQRGFHSVADGSNYDDLGDHRPGMVAGRERGVRSPLQEAELTKAEIRYFMKQRGLPIWDKPAAPCLSSRIPYGQRVTSEKLRQIGEAERFIRQFGIREIRVRHHDKIARIEVSRADIRRLLEDDTADRIVAKLKELGFQHVTLDLKGFRSGSLNEAIPLSLVSARR